MNAAQKRPHPAPTFLLSLSSNKQSTERIGRAHSPVRGARPQSLSVALGETLLAAAIFVSIFDNSAKLRFREESLGGIPL